MAEKAPPRIQPAAMEQQIAAGTPRPVYLLLGPDDEAKARLTAALTATLDEDLRAFNLDKLFPADLRDDARKQFWNVMQLARTLPMMAPRRVIIVAQAEKMMAIFKQGDEDTAPEPAPVPGKRGRKAAPKAGDSELEALEEYLRAPSDTCVLVFVAGPDLKRTVKPVQLLERLATVVDCDPLGDAGDAAAWVKAEAAAQELRIEPGAVRLLARLAGDDITRLRAEFERAVLFASGEGIITEAAVNEIAGAQTTKDPWAMTNAMTSGDAAGALRELAMKFDAGEVPVMILGQLAYYVRARMQPSRAAKAMESVFRTDLAMKTSRGEPRVLLERLIVELCG